MVLNAAIDMLIGLVPFLGDAVDVFWKADRGTSRCSNGTPSGRRDARRLWFVAVVWRC
jgi:hypothetical protein